MSDAGANNAVIFNQDELRQLCAEWQKILRLQDWDVVVQISRRDDTFGNSTMGQVRFNLELKQALIKIIDPIDYPTNVIYPQDMETTLVHELLHLHFAPFDAENDTPAEIAQEQAIEAISKGLVALKRSKNTKEAE